jgi:hypothetical protein
MMSASVPPGWLLTSAIGTSRARIAGTPTCSI